jgi:hypothetical protein
MFSWMFWELASNHRAFPKERHIVQIGFNLSRQKTPSSYILNSRRRIHFELSLAFAQEILDHPKILLVKANAFLEFGPALTMSALALASRGSIHMTRK